MIGRQRESYVRCGAFFVITFTWGTNVSWIEELIGDSGYLTG